MASPLPYTPYQSHRRGASTASSAGVSPSQAPNDAPRAQSVSIQPPQSQGSRHDVVQRRTSSSNNFSRGPIGQHQDAKNGSQSNTQHLSAPNAALNRLSAATDYGAHPETNKAPPPLRSMSSLRNANGPATQTDASALRRELTSAVPSDSSKGKENADQPASARAGTSTVASPSRKSVASSLSVPSPAEAKIDQGHAQYSKRNSLTPSPAPSQTHLHGHSHSRSLSNSALPANLPQIMSTAQRLRTASPIGPSTPRSSSPSYTPVAPGSPSNDAALRDGGALSPKHFALSPTGMNGGIPSVDSVGRVTAYRPGFQPKGTYRVRTDEYMAARSKQKQYSRSGTDETRSNKSRSELNFERLERRIEKLLAIHYDECPLFSEEEALNLAPSWLPGTIRKARLQAEADRRIREQEMTIVKWEDDKSRKQCAICSTSFSLTVRKHHCRSCGRVVCASPHLSMPPGMIGPSTNGKDKRQEADAQSSASEGVKCSGLMIADGQGVKNGMKIKEVPRWDEMVNGGGGVDQEGRTRGIRICRDCRETILHRQYMLDDGELPAYVKLYETLRSLQREIEQSLPEFQEMILGLQKHDAAAALGTVSADGDTVRDPLLEPPSTDDAASIKAKNKTTLALQRDAAQARKQLLANFANYDLIAKKIRNLDDGGNASLARLKMGVYAQANVFLQANMFPLQNLPKLSSTTSSRSNGVGGGHRKTPSTHSNAKTGDATTTAKTIKTAGVNGHASQSQEEIAESISVLEQQLGLVRQYAASASKARKLQDASSLNASARDLEAEIARLRKLRI